MPLRLPAAAARLSRRHFARVFTVACAALLTGAAGCGDDDGPTSSNLNGTYTLRSIENTGLPAQFVDDDGNVTAELESGTLTISGGSRWNAELVINGRSNPASGTVSRDGDALQFTGSATPFTGQLSDNNRTITANVNLFGDGTRFDMVFTR